MKHQTSLKNASFSSIRCLVQKILILAIGGVVSLSPTFSTIQNGQSSRMLFIPPMQIHTQASPHIQLPHIGQPSLPQITSSARNIPAPLHPMPVTIERDTFLFIGTKDTSSLRRSSRQLMWASLSGTIGSLLSASNPSTSIISVGQPSSNLSTINEALRSIKKNALRNLITARKLNTDFIKKQTDFVHIQGSGGRDFIHNEHDFSSQSTAKTFSFIGNDRLKDQSPNPFTRNDRLEDYFSKYRFSKGLLAPYFVEQLFYVERLHKPSIYPLETFYERKPSYKEELIQNPLQPKISNSSPIKTEKNTEEKDSVEKGKRSVLFRNFIQRRELFNIPYFYIPRFSNLESEL